MLKILQRVWYRYLNYCNSTNDDKVNCAAPTTDYHNFLVQVQRYDVWIVTEKVRLSDTTQHTGILSLVCDGTASRYDKSGDCTVHTCQISLLVSFWINIF